SRIQQSRRARRCRAGKAKDCSLVQASEPRDRADAHALKHHRKSFCRNFGRRVVGSQLGFGFREGRFAGDAAIPLDVALSVAPELACSVIAAFACHGGFPLRSGGENATIELRSESWPIPAIRISPAQRLQPEDGALSYSVKLVRWLDGNFHRG